MSSKETSKDGIKLQDEQHEQANPATYPSRNVSIKERETQAVIRKIGDYRPTKTITCGRGLGSIILPEKVMGNRPGKLGKYTTHSETWLILSAELFKENLCQGHTSMVYQSEADLEDDTCGFTLQWVCDIPISIFTNNKRQLKLITAPLTEETLGKWGTFIPSRRSPSAVRVGSSLLQLWVSM